MRWQGVGVHVGESRSSFFDWRLTPWGTLSIARGQSRQPLRSSGRDASVIGRALHKYGAEDLTSSPEDQVARAWRY